MTSWNALKLKSILQRNGQESKIHHTLGEIFVKYDRQLFKKYTNTLNSTQISISYLKGKET